MSGLRAANICRVSDCGMPATRREMCTTHYQRWRRHGDPLVNLHPKVFRRIGEQIEEAGSLRWPMGHPREFELLDAHR